MASSNRKICTLCYNDDGTSTEAVTWCTECEVFLCTDCGKHHKKSSKDHKTMTTKDYHKLPKLMLEISNQCRDHKKKFELYCSTHACPCCVQCVTDTHKKCQEMKQLTDILKQVKSSASVQLFEKDLKDVKENLEEIIKYLNSMIETSYIQKQKAVEQIRSMRKTIDEYLNKLEQEILDDLESKQSQLKSKMNTLLQQLKTQANQLSQLKSEFSIMTRYATELQTYVGLRKIEKTTSQAAKYIEDLKSGDKLDENNLEVTVTSTLQSILNDVKSFGDINIKSRPFTLQVKAGRKDQAQKVVPTIPRIEQIKPSMLRQLKIVGHRHIHVCRLLPDGKYLCLGSQSNKSQLSVFSYDGKFLREVITFTGNSSDTCLVRANTVAVTLGSQKQIALVDIEKNKIIKTIHLSHVCESVASDGQTLGVRSDAKSTIVNLNDESHIILNIEAVEIAIFKGNIYGTFNEEKKVCCYNSTGELLWTFKHNDYFDQRGLSVDKNGFVYLTSFNKTSILVVSQDGKICKTILSEADGILSPWAMDINREIGMMIVIDCIDSLDFSCSEDDDKSYILVHVFKI